MVTKNFDFPKKNKIMVTILHPAYVSDTIHEYDHNTKTKKKKISPYKTAIFGILYIYTYNKIVEKSILYIDYFSKKPSETRCMYVTEAETMVFKIFVCLSVCLFVCVFVRANLRNG